MVAFLAVLTLPNPYVEASWPKEAAGSDSSKRIACIFDSEAYKPPNEIGTAESESVPEVDKQRFLSLISLSNLLKQSAFQ